MLAQPASGFYCPGKADDRTNDIPGSKPILVESGTARTTASVTVDAIEVAFNINAPDAPPVTPLLVESLAAQYSVPPANVAVRPLPDGGGLAVAVTAYEDAKAEAIDAAIAGTSLATLSALLNSTARNQSEPVMTPTTATRQIETLAECPAGARAVA